MLQRMMRVNSARLMNVKSIHRYQSIRGRQGEHAAVVGDAKAPQPARAAKLLARNMITDGLSTEQ